MKRDEATHELASGHLLGRAVRVAGSGGGTSRLVACFPSLSS